VHPQTSAEVTESPIPTTVADPGAKMGVREGVGTGVGVGVGCGVVVATGVGVATAFAGVSWRNPSATLGPEEDVAAQIAAGNRTAPAMSHTRLGRKGSRRRDLMDPTIRTQSWTACRWSRLSGQHRVGRVHVQPGRVVQVSGAAGGDVSVTVLPHDEVGAGVYDDDPMIGFVVDQEVAVGQGQRQ
jgi:hypothetical protein